ncbi:DUF4367 domain-containing protein [Clostridium sp. DJ247]|uniref:DUF4367 domain-containing protein n=1 Tax=Clostridium sp. DJ247 TaxID=2726188 RepID=UPI001629E33F|nr:DUF4367 domain-containing protein [Clostridium sp. DJ247]MBC2581879.1 DUF4367 domain-containing protein [Clostridium sp. DJ247]
MKDNIRDIKEIIDLTLNDIYVTDNLKNKTLKACTIERKPKLKPYIVAAASAAFITLSIVGYQQFYNRDINPSQKLSQAFTKSTSKDIKDKSDNKVVKNQPNNTYDNKTNVDANNIIPYDKQVVYNKDKNEAITNNHNNTTAPLPNTNKDTKTTINKTENQQSNTTNVSPPVDTKPDITTAVSDKLKQDPLIQDKVANINDTSLSSMAEGLPSITKNSTDISGTISNSSVSHMVSPSTAEAENYWGDKLSLPSYVPKDFELTDIYIPKNDSKEKYVKLTYSFKNNYFKLLENKSTTYSGNGKTIDINGAKGYVTQNKDDSNPNSTITQICWNKNNIQFSITGNIPEDDLINICNSIK